MNKLKASEIKSLHNNISPGQAHLTLNEIADMLCLTRERVRQIEAKALLKIRRKMQINGIKLSDII